MFQRRAQPGKEKQSRRRGALVHIEEGIKAYAKDLEENQKAFVAYMARTDSISNVRSTINDHAFGVVEDAVKKQLGTAWPPRSGSRPRTCRTLTTV